MKNLFLFIITTLTITSLYGQNPGLNYQAVLRNGDQLVVNKTVKVKVTLIEESVDGNIVYQEMQNTTTDGLGYLNFMIGEGELLGGKYTDLPGKSDLFIQLEVEIDNSGEMLDFGTTRMGVVHYALYGQDEDADPDNEIQTLSLNGEMLALSRSDSISLSSIASPWKTVDTGQSYVLTFTSEDPLRDDEEEPKKKIRKLRNGGVKEEWEVKGDKICEERTNVDYDDLPDRAQEGIDSMRRKSDKIPDMKEIEFVCTVKKVNDKLVEQRYIGLRGEGEKSELFKIIVEGGGKTVVFGYEKKGKEVLKGTSVKITDDWHQTVVEEKEVKEDNSITPKQTSYQYGPKNLDVSTWIKPGSDGVLSFKDLFETSKDNIISGIGFEFRPNNLSLNLSASYTSDNVTTQAGNIEFDLDTSDGPTIELITGDNNEHFASFNTEQINFKKNNLPSLSLGNFPLTNNSCVGVADLRYITSDTTLGVVLPTIGLGNLGQQPTGFFRLSSDGSALFELTANTLGSPYLGAYTPGGSNTLLTTTSDVNSPYLFMAPPSNEIAAYINMTSDGVGTVGAHNVVTISQNPASSEQLIVYPQLSGSESTIYDRGTATLVNGEITVECPDHFQLLADPQSMTITLTPLSADSKGLAVIEKTNSGFKVKELDQGTGNYSFDYLVMCRRSAQKEHQVYQSKSAYRPADNFAKKELGHHQEAVKN